MKKKIFAASLTALLVLAFLSTGTLSYLTSRANNGVAIKNTFIASSGLITDPVEDPEGDPESKNGFFIYETDQKDPDKKTLGGNTYTVVPNVNIKKDAYVVINGKTDLASYVFIEIIDTLDEELSYTIISDWVDTGLTVKDGGKVYVYKNTINSDFKSGILENDEIVVSKDYAAEDGGSISFRGYICQEASFEAEKAEDYLTSAAAAFTACFGGED